MASKLPPVKGAAYTFRAGLFAQSDNQIKTTPTIAAGDFQLSKDGGALANLATLPTESPASSGQVLISLSATEMNADELWLRALDASGDEWHSNIWTIHTAAQTFDTTDGVADGIATAVADVPTNAELATALAGADDAVLAAIAALAGTSTVTVISTVDGGDASLKQFATWEAVFTLSGAPGLTDYENVIFAVKDSPAQADSESVLYVDTATGLKYIGGAAASAADAGSLTIDSDTAFTVYVSAAEVASKIAASVSGTKDWYLKGIETGGDHDEAIPVAEGTWRVEKGGIRAVA
jgi:hypothetical protein